MSVADGYELHRLAFQHDDVYAARLRVFFGSSLADAESQFVALAVEQTDLHEPEDFWMTVVFEYFQLEGVVAFRKGHPVRIVERGKFVVCAVDAFMIESVEPVVLAYLAEQGFVGS